MKAQGASPNFSHVYAALLAVINTKMPEVRAILSPTSVAVSHSCSALIIAARSVAPLAPLRTFRMCTRRYWQSLTQICPRCVGPLLPASLSLPSPHSTLQPHTKARMMGTHHRTLLTSTLRYWQGSTHRCRGALGRLSPSPPSIAPPSPPIPPPHTHLIINTKMPEVCSRVLLPPPCPIPPILHVRHTHTLRMTGAPPRTFHTPTRRCLQSSAQRCQWCVRAVISPFHCPHFPPFSRHIHT
jgi:hypothetical protein